MATDVPVTIWQPINFNGEMSNQSTLNFITLSGLNLVTLGGDQLVTGISVYTKIPVSVWIEDDSQ